MTVWIHVRRSSTAWPDPPRWPVFRIGATAGDAGDREPHEPTTHIDRLPTILARNGETESGGRLIERVLAGDGTECGSLRVKGK